MFRCDGHALHPLTNGEDTNALGAAELVGAEGHEIHERGDRAEVDPTRSLHRVGVQQRLRGQPTHEFRHRRQVGDGADLVVDRHDADQADRVRIERRLEFVEPDVAAGVDTDDDATPHLDRVQHSVMFAS